uniref:Maturation protein n=1 Tax=Beihai levi-like virus 9 TaxID=1922427 RepID=A0A1L3KI65_9VIRU|nr:hypothetical protein [Beihai levi-like virus 9]
MRHKERNTSKEVIGRYLFRNPYGGQTTHTKTLKLDRFESVDDDTSPKPYVEPNPLDIIKRYEGCVRVSGTVASQLFGVKSSEQWVSYPVVQLVPSFGVDSFTPLGSFASLALERSTPNDPSFNLGEVLFSIREIPKTIRSLQEVLRGVPDVRNLASAYLANEFGLQPMISDLLAILQLQRSLADSARKTRRAERGRSFKGTLYKDSASSRSRHWMSSQWHLHPYDVLNLYETKVWYSVRFRPIGGLSCPPNLSQSFPALAGLDRPLSTIWELVPWSFLVDYFVDVGSYLSNIQAFEHKDICIMRWIDSSSRFKPSSSPPKAVGLWTLSENTLKFKSIPSRYVKKQRAVFKSSLPAPIKFFLSSKQIANILALGLSRRY